MAIDLCSTNTTRYHSVPDHADFTLPNGDWAWVALCYPQSTADTKYIVSTGAIGGATSLNLYLYAGASGFGCTVGAVAEVKATTLPVMDTWYWAYVTRRSGNLFIGAVPLNGSSAGENAGTTISLAYDSTVGPYIGSRSDLTTTRFWKGRWGQIAFISGAGITEAQVVLLAGGTKLLELPQAANINFLLWGQSASTTTLTDMVGSKIATRQGTSYCSNETDAQVPTVGANYIITPSGGLAIAGLSELLKTKVFLSSGGITLSGTGSMVSSNAITYTITPSGGLNLTGTSTTIKTHIQVPLGTIVFSGSAPMESNTVISIVTTRLLLTGVGG